MVGRLDGEQCQHLTAPRRRPSLSGQGQGALQMHAHSDRITRRRSKEPAPRLHLSRRQWIRCFQSNRRRAVEPRFGFGHLSHLDVGEGHTTGGKEGQRVMTQNARCLVGLGATEQGEVRVAMAASVDVDAIKHAGLAFGPLALARQALEPPAKTPDLLHAARVSVLSLFGDVGVGEGNETGHQRPPVAQLLVDLDGLTDQLPRPGEVLHELWIVFRILQRQRVQHLGVLLRIGQEDPTGPAILHNPKLALCRRETRLIPEPARHGRRPFKRLCGSVEVHLRGRGHE